MTDLELTRLCAEAMGRDIAIEGEIVYAKLPKDAAFGGLIYQYDPLHDDAQAMALVKKFAMGIDQGRHDHSGASMLRGTQMYSATAPDLNRAICECVAKMQSTSARQSESAGKRSTA